MLPVRVGEIDREAGPDGADRAAAGRRRRPTPSRTRAAGRATGGHDRIAAEVRRAAAVRSTDSLDGRIGLTARRRAQGSLHRDSLRDRRAGGRRRGLRLLAAPGERAEPARARRAEASRAAARRGCARCGAFRRRCGARSTRCRSSTAGRCRTACFPTATSGYDEFEVELARLRRLRIDVVAFDLLRPIYDHGGGVRPARRRILSSPRRSCESARASARALGPASRRAAALIFDDPHKLVERFPSLLEAYWEEAFAAEWERIEPQLAESVELAGRADRERRRCARSCVTLAPQLRVDAGARQLRARHSARPPRPDQREEPAPARAERLRVAARARQLRPAVAARGRLSRAAPREGLRRSTPPELVQPAEGARRPDAPADPRAAREAAAQHAGACAARRPHRGGHVEAAARSSHRSGC